MKIFIFIGITIGGYIGWWLAESLGGDILVSFMVSSLGSLVGLFIGWKFARNLDL